MPVQINEVIIRAVVGKNSNNEVDSAPQNCGEEDSNAGTNGGGESSDLAEKILEIFREKHER